MDHETLLDALGDRTRRAILERLRSGPQPVVEIAAELPVGRPAVSQHLKVLKAGRLGDRSRRWHAARVPDQSRGARRARTYAQSFWSTALARYQQAAQQQAAVDTASRTGR